ncbi:acyltransferase [Microbacterium album]|uniref:acyltransferase n=1 Tax=Microbacterium album TaxID=2053191 RepID=UPI001E48C183|nr:acyltransferase [Microbacterium album]
MNIYEAVFGDRCFVGPFVEIQNGVVCGDNVRIQSHTLICEGMTIGDDVFVGHGVMTANARYPRAGAAEWTCEPPRIGDRVAVGSNATILPGVAIGDDAVIGAGAIVSKDVAAGTVIVGRDQVLRAPRPAGART